jgi:hypothetical protein
MAHRIASMTDFKPSTRRHFLGTAAGAFAAPLIVPASALGRGATAPSERVTVGIIGSGGRGVFETQTYPWFDNAGIVAVCDARESRRAAAKEKLEKLYGERKPGGAHRGIGMYADFRELLTRRSASCTTWSPTGRRRIPQCWR